MTTKGGWEVKIAQNFDHVVYEWPKRESPPNDFCVPREAQFGVPSCRIGSIQEFQDSSFSYLRPSAFLRLRKYIRGISFILFFHIYHLELLEIRNISATIWKYNNYKNFVVLIFEILRNSSKRGREKSIILQNKGQFFHDVLNSIILGAGYSQSLMTQHNCFSSSYI